jgi:hypothetical protein
MKRMSGRVSAVLTLILAISLPPSFLSGTPAPGKLTFGVYAGWYLGPGPLIQIGGRDPDKFYLDHSLGASIQYNFSALFSLQANVNYQPGRWHWSRIDYGPDGLYVDEGTEKFRFVSINLNGILNESRWRASVFYVLAGGGIAFGDWAEFDGAYIDLMAGVGVKISLSSSHPELALNLGLTFVYLIDPKAYKDCTAEYFRLLTGIEF